jgi:hypothetical protein
LDVGINDDINGQVTAAIAASAAITIKLLVVKLKMMSQKKSKQRNTIIRSRIRKLVASIFEELGDIYFHRAYRMKYSTFCTLADMLGPFIASVSRKSPTSKNYRHNGAILTSVRLASALCWFAGGSIYNIMTTVGISHTKAMDSCWYVVDAINKINNLQFLYPTNHEEQRAIAAEFQAVSAADFKCCAGAIDGILIWIHKPTQKGCNAGGCMSGKFFCGRKKNLV